MVDQVYIDGSWETVATDETITVYDPSTEDVLGEVPAAGDTEVAAAAEAAAAAQSDWGLRSAPERAELIDDILTVVREHRDELASLLTAEVGKPTSAAQDELGFALEIGDYAVGGGRRIEGDVLPANSQSEKVTIERHPHGVVSCIVPWNFPVWIFIRKVAPALVTGNTVVAKPSSNTPLATHRLVELIDEEVDLPDGVLNFLTGHGSDLGDPMVSDGNVDMVSMTGSTGVGRQIAQTAAESLIPASLELGGKAPAIVWKDADLDAAVEDLITARVSNTGQICTCAERIYVHSEVAEEFTEKYVAAAEDITIGDPRDDPDIGPQVSEGELESTHEAVETATAEGARVLTGGNPPEGEEFENGYWYTPTVLTDVTQDMEIIQEEVFGPVSPIIEIDSMDQALEYANDSEYGLSSYLFTNNYRLVNRIADELEFGETYINRTLGEEAQGHHIGWNNSGLGGNDGEDGKYGLLKYTKIKTLYHNYEDPAGTQ